MKKFSHDLRLGPRNGACTGLRGDLPRVDRVLHNGDGREVSSKCVETLCGRGGGRVACVAGGLSRLCGEQCSRAPFCTGGRWETEC